MTNDLILAQRPTVPATILGGGVTRMTAAVAGKIRAGSMALTKEAHADQKARQLYEQGVKSGKAFDEIERDIKLACPSFESPLRPCNPAYFTVRPCDFANPAMADQLLALYGEDRGDGVRLYRFPVIFPADQWQEIMPHQLEAWSASELRFWSDYSADGKTRYCMFRAPPPRGAGNRFQRVFGGRVAQPRTDNGGRCDPNNCPQFQDRQCNLSGRFLFHVPGVASLGVIELHTNSFYALSKAIATFEQVAFLRGGRLSGFLDQNGATFYLTKRLREVSHINQKTGKAERKPQWIIELEANVDVAAMLRASEPAMLIQQGAQAAAMLNGVDEPPGVLAETPTAPERQPAREVADEVILPDGSELRTAARAPKPAAPATARPASQPAQPAPGTATRPAPGRGASAAQSGDVLDPLRQQLNARGIDPDTYFSALDRKTGPGWRLSEFGRRRVAEEIGVLDTRELQARITA